MDVFHLKLSFFFFRGKKFAKKIYIFSDLGSPFGEDHMDAIVNSIKEMDIQLTLMYANSLVVSSHYSHVCSWYLPMNKGIYHTNSIDHKLRRNTETFWCWSHCQRGALALVLHDGRKDGIDCKAIYF